MNRGKREGIAMAGELVTVISLVNQNISGQLFDVRSWENGKLIYPEQDQKPMLRRMKQVTIRKENGKRWLRWEWEPKEDGSLRGVDCGFSGVSEDHRHFETEQIMRIA